MTVKTMDELFLDGLKDMYYAEKQILKSLPKMARKASSKELSAAFEDHQKETEGQIERLEQVFEGLGKAARGKKCDAIEGLIDEAKEKMEDVEDKAVLDAGLLADAQAVEHYEIARYGTLVEWAKLLGHGDAAKLLKANLDEEEATDKKLNGLARSQVNKTAMAA